MDTVRDFSHIGQGNPRVPTSPSLEEDLFLEYFDWSAYCRATQPFEAAPSHYPSSSSSRDLSTLITEIPAVLDSLSIDKRGGRFFNMKTPFNHDEDAVTISEYSGQTPPELVRGGSTSSSDHPSSPPRDRSEDYRHRSDITLREVQAQDDEWTYPQSVSPKAAPRAYPPRLQVSEYQKAGGSHDHASGLKRRRAGDSSEKRHRQLANPVQTAIVRKSGACLPCRVTKIACHDNGVCPKCRAAFPDHAHLVCTRLTPSMAGPVLRELPDVWSRQSQEEEQLVQGPQFYTGNAREIAIFFSRDSPASYLRATVQGYRSYDDVEDVTHLNKVNFPRERVPSHDQLQRWVEAHIKTEHSANFLQALPSFLLTYAQDGSGLPKHGLVNKVHKMNCFFRILKTTTFWCRDPANNVVALPLSVTAQLRNLARKAFRSLEHDVLKDLDDCIAQQRPPKPEERLAVWASSWQLILIYRELIGAFHTHLTWSPSRSRDPMTHATETHQFNWLCDNFFPLLSVFYHYQFRSKKTLELSLDWLKNSKYSRRVWEGLIPFIGNQLIDSRREMYEMFQSSEEEIDQLLCVLVIDHEVKKLNARKRPSKGSSKGSKHAGYDYDDDY